MPLSIKNSAFCSNKFPFQKKHAKVRFRDSMKSAGQKLALYLITPVEEQLKECCQAQKVLFVFAYIYIYTILVQPFMTRNLISLVFFHPLLNRSSRFTNVDFAACDLSVVSDLKSAPMPCCSLDFQPDIPQSSHQLSFNQ